MCVLLGERITYDAREPVYFAHDARILRNFCPASDPIGEALHLQSDEAGERASRERRGRRGRRSFQSTFSWERGEVEREEKVKE